MNYQRIKLFFTNIIERTIKRKQDSIHSTDVYVPRIHHTAYPDHRKTEEGDKQAPNS